ncbi:helix-turn-helix domain-containing protein [Paenibacillus mesophilus]|uniref:AraC family transcriptional regulator n=1 Tax=Paenibacillus mesophilus TaxID=2582849 RepID=UPI00110F001D|nr:AraC family transcriptional regulator [Paenibacillus mesophilus]TMV45025.1 helix-turn-helix domain-containing protein [Paenibacillus mesophilus]
MRYEFLERFFPKMIDVQFRDVRFWEEYQYKVERKPTNLFNFTFVVSGEGTLELNGAAYELAAGAIYHLRPGDHMRIATSPASPLRYYTVHFMHYLLEWEGMQLKVGSEHERLPFEPSFSMAAEYKSMETRMRKLHELWDSQKAGFEWAVRQHFTELLLWLAEQFDSKHRTDDEIAGLISDSMRYIRDHYTQRLARDGLARMASLSPSYYSVLFKKYSGYTPLEYMNKVRLDTAKQMLRSTREPISKIAREVGFQDPLYFTRLFAREVGISPRQFRNG